MLFLNVDYKDLQNEEPFCSPLHTETISLHTKVLNFDLGGANIIMDCSPQTAAPIGRR